MIHKPRHETLLGAKSTLKQAKVRQTLVGPRGEGALRSKGEAAAESSQGHPQREILAKEPFRECAQAGLHGRVCTKESRESPSKKHQGVHSI